MLYNANILELILQQYERSFMVNYHLPLSEVAAVAKLGESILFVAFKPVI